MRTDDFDYHLPEDLIAQQPAPRGTSRMMVVDRRGEGVSHKRIAALPGLIRSDDLVLFNDTRVIPARLRARRATGRKFELLLLRRIADDRWHALVRPSARTRVSEPLELGDGGAVIPIENLGEGRWLVQFDPALELDRLDGIGEVPLPPYIERPAGGVDADRKNYQTVYAANPGAVAAPTAGLHFTEELLAEIRATGCEVSFLTLHVGLGTFRPVQVERIENHEMHAEWYHFTDACAGAVNLALEENRRIVCVGTTTVRALEGALLAGEGRVKSGNGSTDIFLTPGVEFLGVGALLTNFHLPRSTLLMLVSALAGRERILDAYREAVHERYRFFSYGDAMFIE